MPSRRERPRQRENDLTDLSSDIREMTTEELGCVSGGEKTNGDNPAVRIFMSYVVHNTPVPPDFTNGYLKPGHRGYQG